MRTITKLIFTCLVMVVLPVNAAGLPDFKSLVKESSPAVVNISTVQKSNSTRGMNPFSGPNGEEIPEIFRHFFRMPEGGQGERPKRRTPQSLGSGFIISEDGYLLTNHHVIADADKVIVRLSDRRELEAEVIGSDERSDVALLKIDAEDLPTVKVGKSAKLEVGEWVLAIGSPFGFDHSVTAGIVSAKERALANETYVPFIQTDVAINPGNSGGPLFNLDGEVIGINSQIYTRSGGFMGLSFAIPIDVAMNVADQLKSHGFVTRGWLGVIIQEVNRDLAESFGLEKPAGALVAKVLPDSPALSGGLQEGDIILRFEGREVIRSSDLPHFVGRVKPGKKAKVDIVRGGKSKTLRVEIGTLPGKEALAKADYGQPQESRENSLEIQVSELDQKRKEKWQVSAGVVVKRVMQGPGAEAGLMVGDVITMLNGEQIDSVTQFNAVVADLPIGKSVPMRIVRRGSPMFIPLKISN
ncbi:DegQ family serine endoprotease [Neptuniibacter caesariensis]|uniref:Probable periplasmic serine endoprotease DegP-like n=1 Tax=Neptuniibacter caesariensis TaxID=207954 RepID=A0A7U8GRH9_NEPCE|nr:DegQ family serine endoprotease [Neptuniibacter caesariensis]EAR60371.1 alginate biosynthesis negative regulator, serine protease AlgY [Oceanospirillum sp. MED92] [Neptuniibacter caesariensis]